MIYPAFFHYLFELLTSKGIDFPGAGLMHYITFRALMAAIIAIFCSLLIGKRIIKDMHKKQIGEEIRNLGLEGQLRKEGTPTMPYPRTELFRRTDQQETGGQGAENLRGL